MNGKLRFASPSGVLLFSAAGLAGVVAATLFSTVVLLFQSRGTPMEAMVAAERACGPDLYRSERQACVKEWLAAKCMRSLANR
jgi:hypothetical protein